MSCLLRRYIKRVKLMQVIKGNCIMICNNNSIQLNEYKTVAFFLQSKLKFVRLVAHSIQVADRSSRSENLNKTFFTICTKHVN